MTMFQNYSLLQTYCIFVVYFVLSGKSELIVNVSKGSQQENVYRQSIDANLTEDSITIQFLSPKGEHVKQVTDMINKVTVTVYTIPGELDLAEYTYQVICFISAYPGDLIAAEAVTKLRQRYAASVRFPEEHRGNTVQENPVSVDYEKTYYISPLMPNLCREAKEKIFSSEGVLKQIVKNPAKVSALIKKNIQQYQPSRRCGDNSLESAEGCTCGVQHCIWWYPCALKFCRSDGSDGSLGVEHRCGIRTCSKCFTFKYGVSNPAECSWDTP